MSNRPESVAIISIAQQAVPKGIGHSELFRAQLIILSSVVEMTFSPRFVSKPISISDRRMMTRSIQDTKNRETRQLSMT
jgi:hypothetical protein